MPGWGKLQLLVQILEGSAGLLHWLIECQTPVADFSHQSFDPGNKVYFNPTGGTSRLLPNEEQCERHAESFSRHFHLLDGPSGW